MVAQEEPVGIDHGLDRLELANSDIAEPLFVSEGTTKTHVSNVLARLGAWLAIAACLGFVGISTLPGLLFVDWYDSAAGQVYGPALGNLHSLLRSAPLAMGADQREGCRLR